MVGEVNYNDNRRGLRCLCGSTTLVIDSRQEEDRRRRRHKCRACNQRFTTFEITADEYERLQSVKINMSAIRKAISALQVVQKAVN